MADKPPLSDPMAEALREDAEAAAAKAAAAPPAPASVVEPEPEPEPVAAASDESPTTEPEPEPEPDAKPRRGPIEVLQSRLGQKTKETADANARAAEAVRRAEAMQRLLEANGQIVPPDPAGPATAPNGERLYTQAELQAEARRVADLQAFNDRANQTYDTGKEKFGDWEPKMQVLRDMGFMSNELIDAAIASGAAPDVLRHLGGNVEEAERIAALPPIRMGVELGKLATKLAAPKSVRVSGAPAPVTPIVGSASPVVDFSKLADSNDMRAYVEARKKAGDPWATGRRDR